ncbi:flagellar hook protein FlgE [Paenibacillus sp. JGP012]|uniref:Flagellar hook protein FlgE n=1 Tax=Paenibacillus silvae TaxID=1325358 RepID=A0A2W6NJW2_9BACL|nr:MULTISPECIES: flagellar basal body rod protein FlgG [Paenibacillus]MBB6019351.1 flagellar hook protein FlgE [Paenibacillus sp. JGP012]MCK6074046.1 flagellar hook-basal body complex protein [Paenibacillus silvae]MCK6148476.1 flagellar hook-basal body complex protein [Paenibacillus silvae]MCK6266777.1 flagellar hook-basal body complex protein [Paenibacillus silvae]PZT56015.1 flagellar basal body rod protein FlgG [Paenibacillus silvae]
MLKSMYSGVSGMRGFQTKLDVIGNNIANVNTVGFKGSRVMFKDIMSQTTSGVTAPTDTNGGVNAKQIGLGVSVGSIDTLHLAGSPMTTNNPTDLRINGDGFFLVRLSEDQEVPYLTRAGDFHVDSARNLVTSDGLFVLDSGGGNITLGDDVVSFTIGQDGTINQTMADGTTEAGVQLGIGKVVNPSGLEKIGGNLYRMTANANPDGELEPVTANSTENGTGAIIAGQLEMSNVDLTSEFTEMIVAQRGFQANSRIITTSDEVLQEVVNLKR